MNQTQPKNELVWNIIQEPRCPAPQPASYMLLLSALDKGWEITRTELVPSWDQNGFVYLVTLQIPGTQHFQQLILPCGALTDDLLHTSEVRAGSTYPLSQPYLWHG